MLASLLLSVNSFFLELEVMARVCIVTGKVRTRGCRIIRKGQSKVSGGIGTHVVKRTKRLFKPNLQRIRVLFASGEVKRVWVSVKAIKAGLVRKIVS
jgi:large subunit ribosomal protein L28